VHCSCALQTWNADLDLDLDLPLKDFLSRVKNLAGQRQNRGDNPHTLSGKARSLRSLPDVIVFTQKP
jgi:hypothetical protein